MTRKFLKQAGTGDFYPHNDILAERLDMFPVDSSEVPVAFGGTKEDKPTPAVEPKADEPKAKKGKKDEGSAA